MINNSFLNVTSEIGKLKSVLLHRPGKELERLTPQYLEELLFDDIPWLNRMKEEHNAFANLMKEQGTDVYYYEELLKDVLENKHTHKLFVEDLMKNCNIDNKELVNIISEYLLKKTGQEVVEIAITGLHKNDLPQMNRELGLLDYIKSDFPFYINPTPNLYFTRDQGAVIGQGLSINKMATDARNRETMFLKYIYKYHPLFKGESTSLWYDYTEKSSLEGGDILVLSDKVVAIGCSQRTSAKSIEIIAQNLFQNTIVEKVLAIKIPFTRAYMHLDTVFTMVDYDKFTIYPGIENRMDVYELTKGATRPKVRPIDTLENALKSALGLRAIKLIKTGRGDALTASREQWNDASNTLAIAPGVIITYNRNEVSNEYLRENGIEVLEIEGSELVRGRGGPRCMSMPLVREKL